MDWFVWLGFAAALGVAGVFAGFIAGLLGVGGGLILVPVLVHLFGILDVDDAVRMHLAVGTSLATIIPTSIASFRAHHVRGGIDIAVLRTWAPWVAAGVVAGVFTASEVSGKSLSNVFAVMAVGVAAYMAFGSAEARVAAALPAGAAKAIIAFAIGGLATLMGIGGGALMVPTMSLCGYPIKRAIGTAAAMGFVIAVPGTLGFVLAGWNSPMLPPWSVGYVNLLALAVIVSASVLAAPHGAALAHRMDVRALRRVFAVFLVLVAFKMVEF